MKAVKSALAVLTLVLLSFSVTAGHDGSVKSQFSESGVNTQPSGSPGVGEPKSEGAVGSLFDGFFAVTSTQGTSSGEVDDQIFVEQNADFQVDNVCAKADNNPFGTRTFYDVSVWLTFIAPGDDASDGEVLKLSKVGAVDEGECISVNEQNVLVPQKMMYDGQGEYDVEADLVVFDENYEATIITGNQDTGQITLLPKPEEEEKSEQAQELGGTFSISPSEQTDDWLRVPSGEEVDFTIQKNSGKAEALDWTIFDIKDVSEATPVAEGEIDGDKETYKFSYTFEEGGAHQLNARLDPEKARFVAGQTIGDQFYVTEQENEAPEADLDLGRDTIDTGERLNVDISGSEDPDGEIRWYTTSTEKDGENVVKAGEESEFRFSEPGTYTITAEVTDHKGASDTESEEVVVEGTDEEVGSEPDGEDFCDTYPDADECTDREQDRQEDEQDTEPNFKPQITNVQTPGSVTVGETFTAEVVAEDSNDGDTLVYDWSNGATGEQAEFSFDSTGLKTIEVTVTDEAGESVSDSAQVTVSAKDQDGDGIPDKEEVANCVDLQGTGPNGCPPAPQPNVPAQDIQKVVDQRVNAVVESSSFFTFLAASTRPDTVQPDNEVEETLSVQTQAQADFEFEDGNSTRFYGVPVVIKDGEIQSKGEPRVLDSENGKVVFQNSFAEKFSETGTYAFQVQIVESQANYRFGVGEWNYETSLVDSNRYTFQVESTTPTSNPGGSVPEVPGLGDSGLAVLLLLVAGLVAGGLVYARETQ